MRISFLSFCFSFLSLSSICFAGRTGPGKAIDTTVVVFQPPANWIRDRVASARSLVLDDGTILVSHDVDPPLGDPKGIYFQVWKSTDQGKTFTAWSRVYDQRGHGGMRYESHLFLLKRPMGDFPAGTVFLAGNAVPDSHQTSNLDLYASADNGKTWKFVSTIASGGEAFPVNGKKAVWEPFLFQPSKGDTIYCYYSDQRDPKYGQKIVHTSTKDLRNWSPVVNDVTASVWEFRPGMPVVSELNNGEYFMSYEFAGAPERAFAVYSKISRDPNSWADKVGELVKVETGEILTSSPYNVFTNRGGDQGTLILNAGSSKMLYINKNAGRGVWKPLNTHAPASYSRGLMLSQDPNYVMITGGGPGGGHTAQAKVTFTLARVV